MVITLLLKYFSENLFCWVFIYSLDIIWQISYEKNRLGLEKNSDKRKKV